ncbi:YegP family protein [Mesorhizobium sp. L-2-11]|uniref:YegP family protein n=1 Tax=Mesorhizobium sp. L-2-11 TaxID=2744521 RepID=UPI001925F259|nr:DUF1508 domain-containing protein [Mesorhizobium sp. L-2-11]BCH18861.1 hypothetical protein MesoLjLa_57120 [Mesorhizobium sp. L-2-11]
MADRPFPSFWLYKDARGEWRWTFHATNREPIAVSSEGYVRKADCRHGIDLIAVGTNWPVWSPIDQVNMP